MIDAGTLMLMLLFLPPVVILIITIPAVWFHVAPLICTVLGGHRWRDMALYDGVNKSDACRYCTRCAEVER